MQIDTRFRVDRIAHASGVTILSHVLVTTWHDETVLVAADGWTLAVVPIELDERDQPGLLHASVIERAFMLAGVDDEDLAVRPAEVAIRLGHRHARLSDGSILPRVQPTDGREFPDWRKCIPSPVVNAELGPVFGIQPSLLHTTAQAIGAQFVAVHRANLTQIVVTPVPIEDVLEPPFAVMMLAEINRLAERVTTAGAVS